MSSFVGFFCVFVWGYWLSCVCWGGGGGGGGGWGGVVFGCGGGGKGGVCFWGWGVGGRGWRRVIGDFLYLCV